MPRNSYAVPLLLVAFAIGLSSAVANAGDRDYDAVVRHIQQQYKADKQKTPGMGLARFFVKIAHPAGLKSIRITVFEKLSGATDDANLSAVLRDKLSADWQPLIRVYSRKEREQTFVYARPSGNDMEFFVVAIDDEEATVVKAKVDIDSAADWIHDQDWFDTARN